MGSQHGKISIVCITHKLLNEDLDLKLSKEAKVAPHTLGDIFHLILYEITSILSTNKSPELQG